MRARSVSSRLVIVERLRAGRDGDLDRQRRRLRRDADASEEVALKVLRDLRAEQPVHAARPERDPRRSRLVGRRVDAPGGHGAASPLRDQSRRPVRPEPGQPELLALLEPEAGLAAEGVALAGPPDRHGVEDRRLDDDVGRTVLDLGRRVAHDAGDADRAAGVRDEEGVRVERPLDVVERLDPFAGLRAPDDQPVAAVGPRRDPCRVVRVDRLAELEHHVVARVDDVADRAGRRRPGGASGRDPATARSTLRRPNGRRTAGTNPSREPRRRRTARPDRRTPAGPCRGTGPGPRLPRRPRGRARRG